MAKDIKTAELPLTSEVEDQQEAMPTTVSVNPHYLIQKAIEAGNIDAVERMVALTERLQAKWARDQYFTALSRFQKECPIIERSSRVDFTGKSSGVRTTYNYAPFDVILSAKNDAGETIQQLLEKHGFSYETKTRQTEKDVTALVIAHHKFGHAEPTEFTVPIDFDSYMSPPQKVRSARTYAIRTAFEDAFGLVTAAPDDDGSAGATESVRSGLKPGEKETIVGEVPQMYWKAERGSTKQQMILVEKYGPAKRYEVRKIEDASAPKGHVWRVVKIDDVSMTETLKGAIQQAEQTIPKGQGDEDEVSPEKEIKKLMDKLFTDNPWLHKFDQDRAVEEWKACMTYDGRKAVYDKWKHESEERELKMV